MSEARISTMPDDVWGRRFDFKNALTACVRAADDMAAARARLKKAVGRLPELCQPDAAFVFEVDLKMYLVEFADEGLPDINEIQKL